MKALLNIWRGLIAPIPALVPLGIAVAFVVVGVSQCSTIKNRNDTIESRTAQRDSARTALAGCEGVITKAETDYETWTKAMAVQLDSALRATGKLPVAAQRTAVLQLLTEGGMLRQPNQ